MTMLDAAQKIPKGVNIIIFIWALIGLYLLIRDPKFKKDFYFWLYTLVIAFMVAWLDGRGNPTLPGSPVHGRGR